MRKILTMLAVYILTAALLSAFSQHYPKLANVFMLLFIAASAAVIMLLYRYLLTQYIYQLTLTELVVIRFVGRQSTVACSFALEDSKLLISKQAFFKDGYDEKWAHISQKSECCQNIYARCYYYICGEDGKEMLLKFEPNEVFIRAMNENISNAKRDDK